MKPRSTSVKTIQGEFFRSQLLLIFLLAVFLGFFGALVNVKYENTKKRRQYSQRRQNDRSNADC